MKHILVFSFMIGGLILFIPNVRGEESLAAEPVHAEDSIEETTREDGIEEEVSELKEGEEGKI